MGTINNGLVKIVLMRSRAANLAERLTIKTYNMQEWEYLKHAFPYDFL